MESTHGIAYSKGHPGIESALHSSTLNEDWVNGAKTSSETCGEAKFRKELDRMSIAV